MMNYQNLNILYSYSEDLQYDYDYDGPSTIDETLADTAFSIDDNCGIEYGYHMNDIAAADVLEEIENEEYTMDLDFDQLSVFTQPLFTYYLLYSPYVLHISIHIQS